MTFEAKRPLTTATPRPAGKEGYTEPLLLKHEPLRDITGQKYGEKAGVEKAGLED
jgi:hypothetical protein